MKIRTKITTLMTGLMAAVVAAIALNLICVERSHIREESEARTRAVMEGVLRIARESITAKDELMLLSYLKFLMRDYPEIEVSMVSLEDHNSLLGQVRTELFFETVTVTEPGAGSYRQAAAAAPSPAAAALPRPRTIPPNTMMIELGFSKTILDRRIRQAQLALAERISGLAALGLLLGLAGSWWVAWLIARPMSALARATQSFGEGRLEAAVVSGGDDEVADLARRFNAMTQNIRQSLRFKEDLLATLTHELNNPLGGLRGFLQHLLKSKEIGERRQSYETMLETVSQMELSLGNALQLFKAGARPSLKLDTVNLSESLDEAVRLFAPLAKSNQMELKRTPGPSIAAAADKELLRRVFINLVSNALKFTPTGGSVTVRLEDKGPEAEIIVADTGPGIAAEDRERIFTKFYRAPGPDGKPQRIPGSGLGLAIAKQAVDLHRGRIWVKSETGKGSEFHVLIPKNQSGKSL